MKEVKQRISLYVNKQCKRSGTLWEGRFKSPIVERTPEAILAVSTYIDLNPVRAGMVDRPEEYRWSGYSAALAGNEVARKGLASIYAMNSCDAGRIPSWSSIKAEYRQYLFEKGIEVMSDQATGGKGRKGISAIEVEREIERRGELPLHEVICHRVRYFSDGVVIGSAGFVDRIFKTHRERLVAPDSKRSSGARTMRGAKWGNLTTLRDLRVNVIGFPS
jgi:putative transposase